LHALMGAIKDGDAAAAADAAQRHVMTASASVFMPVIPE